MTEPTEPCEDTPDIDVWECEDTPDTHVWEGASVRRREDGDCEVVFRCTRCPRWQLRIIRGELAREIAAVIEQMAEVAQATGSVMAIAPRGRPSISDSYLPMELAAIRRRFLAAAREDLKVDANTGSLAGYR